MNNLKQEAKRAHQLERGIHPTNRMEDCLKTMSNIVQMDICSRNDRRPDGNDVLAGIVRRCTFVPSSNLVGAPSIAPDFILHDRASCVFFGELCEREKVLVSLDSTAGMTNFTDTPFDGKIQHSVLLLQYKESVISKGQLKFTKRYDFSSFPLSERVSSWQVRYAAGQVIGEMM